MPTEAATCTAVLGLDVGKFSHWACHVTRRGEVLASGSAANTERDLDGLFGRVGAGTLVVVDQFRNTGSLAISRARLAGLPVVYLPGIAAHGAARLFAGDAKADERDATVIAKTALDIPDSLLPVPRRDEKLEAARSMAAQRSHMVACSTRDKNRLRSLLLERCPAFEALTDLADPHWLKMMEALGGPWGIVDAGRATVGAVTRGADRSRIDAAIAAAAATRPSEYRVAAENPQVRMLARHIRESAGGGQAQCRNSRAARRGRHVRVPADRPGDRPQDRVRAGGGHRHRRLSRPRPPRVPLRGRAQEPAVGQVHIVGGLVPPGEQAAEEPAHLLLQLALLQQGPVRRLLPQLQESRHAPRGGPEGRCQEEIEGDLRDHEGQGPVLGLAGRLCIEEAQGPWVLRQHCLLGEKQSRKSVDKTIGTHPIASRRPDTQPIRSADAIRSHLRATSVRTNDPTMHPAKQSPQLSKAPQLQKRALIGVRTRRRALTNAHIPREKDMRRHYSQSLKMTKTRLQPYP